jgi:hypothetical protein
VQRPAIFPGAQFLLRLRGLAQSQIGGHRNEAVQLPVNGVNSFNTSLGKFHRRELSAPEPGGGLRDRETAGIVGRHDG